VGKSFKGHALEPYIHQGTPSALSQTKNRSTKRHKKDKRKKHSKKSSHTHPTSTRTSTNESTNAKRITDVEDALERESYLNQDSEDVSSLEDEHLLALVRVPDNKEIVFLPDGSHTIVDKRTEESQYVIDRKGDRDLLLYGEHYRLDIPNYDLTSIGSRSKRRKTSLTHLRQLHTTSILHVGEGEVGNLRLQGEEHNISLLFYAGRRKILRL
jgi:hypothetical protein